ncbi:hypothetical protein [Nitratireductor pacificus]|uniref:Flagellar basal body-associated protein FliL n=1 Tax=Nitratireductor pacificus pht-3B TaxID=391937 RepID=K2M885_9HYPH|nr:hypothetical protein [Nitratireductor pacificus]EKF17125.1 hypothetical protein NA2_19533 [Nitratireductor pacificus pht-3B]
MIKFILAAIWICAVSVGAVLYSFQFSQARNTAEPPPAFFGGLDHISTDLVSVPLVRDGSVEGYFLTRLSYAIDSEKLKALTVPVSAVLVDEIYSYLYANPQIDYSKEGAFDIGAFRDGLRDRINERVDSKLIHEIFIEQADYLTKDEIRSNTARRRIGPGEGAAQAPSKSGAH